MNSDFIQSAIVKAVIALGTYWATREGLSIDGSTWQMMGAALAALAAGGYRLFQAWDQKKVPANSTAVQTVGTPPIGATVTGKVVGALAVFLLLLPASGYAADVNKPALFVKSPLPQTTCTLMQCSGPFAGITFANEGGNLDILGTGLSGVANGTALGAYAGYEFWNGQWYARAKAFASYDISLQSSTGPASSISDKFAWGGCASLGYSLASAFGGGATGTQQPTVPLALAQALMTPYFNVCAKKHHGQQASGGGAGFEALLATNWTANVDYIHWQYGSGSAADGVIVPARKSENEVTAGISYHFGPR